MEGEKDWIWELMFELPPENCFISACGVLVMDVPNWVALGASCSWDTSNVLTEIENLIDNKWTVNYEN